MAVCVALGEFLAIRALEIAQAIAQPPAHCSLTIWTTFYGWLVFEQQQDRGPWLGVAIIVATDRFLVNREWTLSRGAKRG